MGWYDVRMLTGLLLSTIFMTPSGRFLQQIDGTVLSKAVVSVMCILFCRMVEAATYTLENEIVRTDTV